MKTLTTDYQPMGRSVDLQSREILRWLVRKVKLTSSFMPAGKRTSIKPLCITRFGAPEGYDAAGNLYVEALLYGSAEPLSGYSDPLALRAAARRCSRYEPRT